MKKTDIILAGVGGQGILSIAAVIGLAAINEGLSIKQAEVHGMSQRGGAVQSHLRISGNPIYSDLIPQGAADLILSVEPMEVLRYLPWLSRGGWLVSNSEPFVNIPAYPDPDSILFEIKNFKNSVLINADGIAKKMASLKASNMVMLGAASPFINLNVISLENGIRQLFNSKGESVVTLNLQAFHSGRQSSSEQNIKSFTNGIL
jgi:indolepyruvate ferredoxin oxidoreductase, beta subunit